VESEKVKISSTSDGLYTLRLSHLTDEDSGQYTIKALNDAGQTSCTATLLVHGTLPRQLVPVASLVVLVLVVLCYFAHERGAKYCDLQYDCLSVCLLACLKSHASKLREICCTC